MLTADNNCPNSINVDQKPFDMKLDMLDAFGTVVKGQFYEMFVWTLQLTQEPFSEDCSMGEDAEISTSFEESGIASIDNVILYALSGTKCPLRFTPHSSNRTSVHVPPIECVVTLKDCPKNYETRPVQGKSYLTLYDTCVYGEPLKCTFLCFLPPFRCSPTLHRR